MKRYSPGRKAAVLAKLQEEISDATLYNWRNQARLEGKPVPGAHKTTEQWSSEARFAVMGETTTLSEAELGEYCRRKGLYSPQIAQWKQAFIEQNNDSPVDKTQLKQQAKENKQLKREVARKEKALAEAAALLVLRKKLNRYYGIEDEDD